MVFLELLQPDILIPWLLGMFFGVFVGATPGLTATMAVALIVPISYHLDPTAGLAMIIGVSFTAIFAGDIPATFLRIPGTPASAAATLDSHELALQGRGRLAMSLDLLCSCVGGLIGVGALVLIAPYLARFALQFSAWEYFWLGIFGLSMSAVVSMGNTFRGLISAALGMFVATIGQDIVSNAPRYTFGYVEAMGGLHFIPVMIGVFGLSEVFRNVRRHAALGQSAVPEDKSDTIRTTISQAWRMRWTVLPSAVAGTLIGALPGAGADIAAWGAYGMAKKISKEPEKFGHGSLEGVVAPTSANNAAIAGAWIPALVFGVPGDAVTAIVLGVLQVHGIKPGPFFFEDGGRQVTAIFAIAAVTQLLLLPIGLLGIRTFSWILQLPRNIVLTAVMIFSVVGAYALHNSMFDVWVMFAFGLVGLFLESRRVPLAPMILGLILGPIVELNLRTGLIASSGSFAPFVTRPICMFLIALMAVMLVGGVISRLWSKLSKNS